LCISRLKVQAFLYQIRLVRTRFSLWSLWRPRARAAGRQQSIQQPDRRHQSFFPVAAWTVEGKWYRFHPICFSDVLRERGAKCGPAMSGCKGILACL